MRIIANLSYKTHFTMKNKKLIQRLVVHLYKAFAWERAGHELGFILEKAFQHEDHEE